MYRIQIIELIEQPKDGPVTEIERVSLTVDEVDITAVVMAATRKPRKPRSDKGKPRQEATLV